MGANGQVIVDAQVLDEGASDADSVAGQIQQRLGDLHGYLSPLVASWTGEASSDYQALQQRWDTTADDLNAVLREIAGALRTAAQSYVTGERGNAAMWEG
jgi:early secretory antigenic target protein ESAT-6